jgi:Lon protease-like protein
MQAGAIIEELPIFPLPDLVFFPRTLLPLHVFEPRYLALVRRVMETDRRMGVVQLQPGWESEYYGAPTVHPVLGLGEVLKQDDAPDGRLNILLRGLARLRVLDEPRTGLPFRVVRAELLADAWEHGDRDRVQRHLLAIRQLFLGILARIPGLDMKQAEALFDPGTEASLVVDAVASALPLLPAAKQEILAELRVARRAERLLELVAGIAADGLMGDGPASGRGVGA